MTATLAPTRVEQLAAFVAGTRFDGLSEVSTKEEADRSLPYLLAVALLDAAFMRLLLMRVMLRLLGKWAWCLLRPLHRVLPEVRFGQV